VPRGQEAACTRQFSGKLSAMKNLNPCSRGGHRSHEHRFVTDGTVAVLSRLLEHFQSQQACGSNTSCVRGSPLQVLIRVGYESMVGVMTEMK